MIICTADTEVCRCLIPSAHIAGGRAEDAAEAPSHLPEAGPQGQATAAAQVSVAQAKGAGAGVDQQPMDAQEAAEQPQAGVQV